MNSLIETLNRVGENIPSLAWQMFWQSSLIIAAIFALDFLLRRKVRASVRYTLWLVALIKLVLPPALALPTGLAWWVRSSDLPPAIPQAGQFVVTYPNQPMIFQALPMRAAYVPPAPHLSIEAWGLIGAALVSVALLAWMMIRWIHIGRLVRRAGEPGETIRVALEEACSLNLVGTRSTASQTCGNNGDAVERVPTDCETTRVGRTRVSVLITKEKMSPAVCGLFRPVILLPESLAESLSPNQLRAVLIHELVHLKRGDVWVNCLQALLQIVYWWHPFVWFANARIRRVREEAVDDAVMLALRDEADCYAPTLLEVAKLAFQRPLASLGLVGILESRSALRQRIERLVDFKTPRRTGLSLVSILAIAAFTAVAVPMGEAPAPQQIELKSPVHVAEKAAPQSDIVVTATNVPASRVPFPLQLAQNLSVLTAQSSSATTPASPLDGVLAFDKELKETTVNAGEPEAKFKFSLTNVSSFAVTITNVLTSCGCTVAKMPASPWLLAPGASGEIPVTMNVAGKSGVVTKTVSVCSESGTKVLTVKATILPLNVAATPPMIRTSPGRKALIQKLDQIHFDRIGFDAVPLSEVVRQLSGQVKQRDPDHVGINFLINPQAAPAPGATIDPITGLPIPPPSKAGTSDINAVTISINPPLMNVRLADVLDAIVTMSETPIKYSILDYAVVFSLKSGNETLPLHQRRFHMDPNTFKQGLEGVSGIKLSTPAEAGAPGMLFPKASVNSTSSEATTARSFQTALLGYFQSLGVNMDPPKNVFYGDLRGDLWVRATDEDLDIIEKAIQPLNIVPPQINIRVKFIEMPKDLAESICPQETSTNGEGVIGILTDPARKQLLARLKLAPGVTEISDGNVTTLSDRQTQFQSMDLTNAVVGVLDDSPETKRIMVGPTLDVIASVSGDQHTIQMKLVPALSEFLGYETPEIANANGQPKPLPHFRIRQVKTSAIISDGQTVVLGRLPQTESVPGNATPAWATAEDPKRTFVVLVTATLIDPAGNRIHSDD